MKKKLPLILLSLSVWGGQMAFAQNVTSGNISEREAYWQLNADC